ncbi:MAG: ABC transporter permease [Corallococcus sp.]|nr:ABC transporter permease [Corallococcus sp.]
MKKYEGLSQSHIQYLKSENRKKVLIHLLQVGVLIFILGIWELLAQTGAIDSFITSSPSRVAKTLAELAANGSLWKHTFVSTYETVAGFVIGTALGYMIAVILWWNEYLQKIFEPYLVVLNSLPKIALGPLIILWAGTGKASIITMAVLISVVITAITVLQGFIDTDKDKILLLKSMNATRMQIFVKLVAPANIPTLLATLKINVGMSWVGSIMGEYLVSKEGLGYLLIYGSQTFKLDLVMTCTIVLCVLAGIMYALVALLEKLVLKHR